jgi:hypothetical protein
LRLYNSSARPHEPGLVRLDAEPAALPSDLAPPDFAKTSSGQAIEVRDLSHDANYSHAAHKRPCATPAFQDVVPVARSLL